VGKVLIVKFQISPSVLLRMLNNAMNATSWLRIGALWIGRNRIRSTTMPPTNDTITATAKASQYGWSQAISCQAIKAENVAISPWAEFRGSIAWEIITTANAHSA